MAGGFRACLKQDGSMGEIRVPQDVFLGLVRMSLTASELRVALAVLFRQYQFAEDGAAAVAIKSEELMSELGISRRSVFSALDRLVSLRVLSRSGGGGSGKASDLAVRPPSAWQTVQPTAPFTAPETVQPTAPFGPEGCSSPHPNSAADCTGGCNPLHKTVQRPNSRARVSSTPSTLSSTPSTPPNPPTGGGSGAVKDPSISAEAAEHLAGYAGLGYTVSHRDRLRAEEHVAEFGRRLSPALMLDRMRGHLDWCAAEGKPKPRTLTGFTRTLRHEHDRRADAGQAPRDSAARDGTGPASIAAIVDRWRGAGAPSTAPHEGGPA